MIMLPIPVSITALQPRPIRAFIYLSATASLCYISLIPFHQRISAVKDHPTQPHPTHLWKIKRQAQDQDGRTGRSYPSKVWSGYQDVVDVRAPTHQSWPHDPQCARFITHFAKPKTFRPRALVSFPGSGNSWLRYLLESTTGIFTGSVFKDGGLLVGGLLGEMRSPLDGSTLVQKTHHDALRLSYPKTRRAYVKLSELGFGYRGLLLVRNPYDALISYWNFIQTRDHHGHANNTLFNATEWRKFVVFLIPLWSSLIRDWVVNSPSLHIVEYDELRRDPRGELTRIVLYLGGRVDEGRMGCVLKHVEGPFHRTHHSSPSPHPNSFFFPKTSDLSLIVQQNIQDVNRLFVERDIPLTLNYSGPTT